MKPWLSSFLVSSNPLILERKSIMCKWSGIAFLFSLGIIIILMIDLIFIVGKCDRSVVFSTNKTDHHDLTEIVLKVALKTIKQPTNQLTNHFMHKSGVYKDNMINIESE